MTRWTKPEDYTDKGIAWTMLRERLRDGPLILPRGNLDQWARWFSDDYAEIAKPEGGRASRYRAAFGGSRSGKTARTSTEAGFRTMGHDLSREPDKSVRAKWINGRLWILEDGYDG